MCVLPPVVAASLPGLAGHQTTRKTDKQPLDPFSTQQTSSSIPARRTCSSKTRANRAWAVSPVNFSVSRPIREGGRGVNVACLLADAERGTVTRPSGAGNYLWRKSSTFRDTGNTASLSCTGSFLSFSPLVPGPFPFLTLSELPLVYQTCRTRLRAGSSPTKSRSAAGLSRSRPSVSLD